MGGSETLLGLPEFLSSFSEEVLLPRRSMGCLAPGSGIAPAGIKTDYSAGHGPGPQGGGSWGSRPGLPHSSSPK